MKHLTINSHQYVLALKGFTEWLTTLGYSESVITNYPSGVKELLHYLEERSISKLEDIMANDIDGFIEHIKTRINHTTGGGLSGSHVNGIIKSVNKFITYISHSRGIFIQGEIKLIATDQQPRDILTVEEVKLLFKVLEESPNPVQQRDKAVLSILYGAGLRKKELEALTVDDISFEKQLIHVKAGKGGKERLVPLTGKLLENVMEYVTGYRDILVDLTTTKETSLFINIQGNPISETNYYNIIKTLLEVADCETIRNKNISLHSFRHSIATHLLQGGMELESIAKFLGHTSLDSTMIYTHLAEQLKE